LRSFNYNVRKAIIALSEKYFPVFSLYVAPFSYDSAQNESTVKCSAKFGGNFPFSPITVERGDESRQKNKN